MPDLVNVETRHARFYQTRLARADELYFAGGDSTDLAVELFRSELETILNGQAYAVNHLTDPALAGLCCDFAVNGANLINLYFHPKDQVQWGESALVAAQSLNNRALESIILSNLG